MTPAVIRIASRADGSHVPVAVFIVNNRPETRERIRPHVKVGFTPRSSTPRGNCRVLGAAQHEAQRNDALQTPISGLPEDRRPYARKSGKPDLRGPFQSVAVPDQRCHSASKTRVNALMAPLRYALHRVRDT